MKSCIRTVSSLQQHRNCDFHYMFQLEVYPPYPIHMIRSILDVLSGFFERTKYVSLDIHKIRNTTFRTTTSFPESTSYTEFAKSSSGGINFTYFPIPNYHEVHWATVNDSVETFQNNVEPSTTLDNLTFDTDYSKLVINHQPSASYTISSIIISNSEMEIINRDIFNERHIRNFTTMNGSVFVSTMSNYQSKGADDLQHSINNNRIEVLTSNGEGKSHVTKSFMSYMPYFKPRKIVIAEIHNSSRLNETAVIPQVRSYF